MIKLLLKTYGDRFDEWHAMLDDLKWTSRLFCLCLMVLFLMMTAHLSVVYLPAIYSVLVHIGVFASVYFLAATRVHYLLNLQENDEENV